jgi:hypothetical protein
MNQPVVYSNNAVPVLSATLDRGEGDTNLRLLLHFFGKDGTKVVEVETVGHTGVVITEPSVYTEEKHQYS